MLKTLGPVPRPPTRALAPRPSPSTRFLVQVLPLAGEGPGLSTHSCGLPCPCGFGGSIDNVHAQLGLTVGKSVCKLGAMAQAGWSHLECSPSDLQKVKCNRPKSEARPRPGCLIKGTINPDPALTVTVPVN